MGGKQQDELRVGEISRGPVVAGPQCIPDAGARTTDVRVAVVPVDAPRLERAVHEPVLARAPDVVHDLIVATLTDSGPHPSSDVCEGFLPGDTLPLTASSLAHTAHRVEDPLGVVDLVDRRRAFCTVASPRSRVCWIAFEPLDLARVLVDVGKESARRLAVEACGRYEAVSVCYLLRPCLRVVLLPVVPAVWRREVREVCALSDPWKLVVCCHLILTSTERSGRLVRTHHREARLRPWQKDRRSHPRGQAPRR